MSLKEKPASVEVSDLLLKSGAMAAAGAYLFRMGNHYLFCFPEANILDAAPSLFGALLFWFLAGRLLIDGWFRPALDLVTVAAIRIVIRMVIAAAMVSAMCAILVVASAGDGLLGADDECRTPVKLWVFPLSN